MACNPLLSLVKRKLNVTWDDEDTDARICDLIADAKVEIADKVGIKPLDGMPFDYTQPGQERKLLLAYCLYGWNNALDDFDANYASDILQARERWEVVAYGAEDKEQGVQ